MDGISFSTGLSIAERAGRWLRSLLKRPRVSILPFDAAANLKVWTFANPPVHQKKFWTVEVRVAGGQSAKRCVAIAEVHQVAPVVKNRGTFALHWADIDYKFRTTGADPADIGPEGLRLDVGFTFPGQPDAGCWMATMGAVAAPLMRGEDFLTPGTYVVRIVIRSDNAGATATTYNLTSPDTWDGLDVNAGDS